MRRTCRKPKIFEIFETIFEVFDATFETYIVIFEIGGTSISSKKFAASIINNVEIIIIIHFIVELCDIIIKSSYNFRN